MYKIFLPAFFLVCSGIWSSAFAQDRLANPRLTYASTITGAEMKEVMSFLASDDFEGRETGTKGQKMAAKLISTFYKINNVEHTGSGSGYFQHFELIEVSWGNRWIIAGDSVYRFFEDFYAWSGQNDSINFTANQFLFLGYGIDDPQYSDYKKQDVKGKILVVLDGEPVYKGISGITRTDSLSAWSTDRELKLKTAMDRGAEAILVVDSRFDERMSNERLRKYIDHSSMKLKEDYTYKEMCNLIFISPAMAAEWMGADWLETARVKMNKRRKPVHQNFQKPVQLYLSKIQEEVFTENVVGFVEGTDLKDEVIVVSAHYDHIGIIDGEVYNGADDDASGTVAVMEIAQAFQLAKNGGYGPRRSLLFLSFSAEEKGLLGSDYYTRHPILPLENTIANLNIDMIGRVDEAHAADSQYVYIIGADFLSTELYSINAENAKTYTKLKLDYTYNDKNDPNRFYYRSDHYHFAKNNIPVIFYFNGTHADYHQAGDEMDKINFSLLEQRARLIFQDAWTLANMDNRLEVDVPQELE